MRTTTRKVVDQVELARQAAGRIAKGQCPRCGKLMEKVTFPWQKCDDCFKRSPFSRNLSVTSKGNGGFWNWDNQIDKSGRKDFKEQEVEESIVLNAANAFNAHLAKVVELRNSGKDLFTNAQ